MDGQDKPRGPVAIAALLAIADGSGTVVVRGISFNEFSMSPQRCADLAAVIYQLPERAVRDDGSAR